MKKHTFNVAVALIEFHYAWSSLVDLFYNTDVEDQLMKDDELYLKFANNLPFNDSLFDYDVHTWVKSSLDKLGASSIPLLEREYSYTMETEHVLKELATLTGNLSKASAKLNNAWDGDTVEDELDIDYPFTGCFNELCHKISEWTTVIRLSIL